MPPDPTKPSLRTIPSQRLGFPAHHPPALPCLPLHPSTCWHPSSLCTPSCPLLNDHHPCTLTPERVTAHPKKLAQHHPNHSRQVPPQIHVRREGVRRCWLGERNGRKLLQLGPPQNKVIFNLDHFSVFKVSWFKPNLFCWGQKSHPLPSTVPTNQGWCLHAPSSPLPQVSQKQRRVLCQACHPFNFFHRYNSNKFDVCCGLARKS